jgi:hypothetical protein
VSTPNTNRIALGIVNVLARRMLAYERLVGGAGSVPRSRRRRSASASVRPSGAVVAAAVVAMERTLLGP